MVLDVGGGTTCAAAVHDGYVLNKPLKRTPLAGDLLTELALKSVSMHEPAPAIRPVYSVHASDDSKAHATYRKYQELQVLREAKECVCRCSMHTPNEQYPLNSESWEHELPDRSMLDMAWERFHLPELYFQPSLLKNGLPGLTQPPWLSTTTGTAAPPARTAELVRLRVTRGAVATESAVAAASHQGPFPFELLRSRPY